MHPLVVRILPADAAHFKVLSVKGSFAVGYCIDLPLFARLNGGKVHGNTVWGSHHSAEYIVYESGYVTVSAPTEQTLRETCSRMILNMDKYKTTGARLRSK